MKHLGRPFIKRSEIGLRNSVHNLVCVVQCFLILISSSNTVVLNVWVIKSHSLYIQICHLDDAQEPIKIVQLLLLVLIQVLIGMTCR